jgi:outer membrane lipoprotein SlyB
VLLGCGVRVGVGTGAVALGAAVSVAGGWLGTGVQEERRRKNRTKSDDINKFIQGFLSSSFAFLTI